ncbi:glutamate 5-kinase [Sporormia fimetaria CBS 119925]|uniref:Glutamate 5-kinase n=1 Tax=Sporormia fimetaria CBS 119925 TaxID=1340428 RepID=A0A6A6V8V3_9PLEO|nr:glutamate 5-kinase [Sporormia fimetaria CBS 119925]
MAVHLKREFPGQLTVVIKLGTSSIVDEKTHQPLLSILSLIVETADQLRQDGHRVVIVSSGAIGVGLRRMDLPKRPKHLSQMQALAAIGQCRLMSLWDRLFELVRQPIAQVLLTRNDIADRTQYQNAQNTFFELLSMGVIPIVNENDTLAVTEIKFGDNDTLSAITAGMVQADYLFLMTDVDCLYDKNPRTNPDAKPITVIEDIAELEADVSSAGSALGTGGMSTKIVAARLATSAGVTTVITKSSNPGNIASIIKYAEVERAARSSSRNSVAGFDGEDALLPPAAGSTPRESPSPMAASIGSLSELTKQTTLSEVPLHTRFLPIAHPIRDRWFWILHGLAPHGVLYIDHGAWHALSDKAGLLPAGIVDVDGDFAQQEAVRIVVVKRLKSRHSDHKDKHSEQTQAPTQLYHPHPTHPTPTPDRTSLYERSNQTPNPLTQTLSNSALSLREYREPLYELHNPAPFEIGRCVVNYAAKEIKKIMGLHSTQIHDALGYADSEYVAVRENIAFFDIERSRPSTPAFGKAAEGAGAQ